MAKLGKTCFLQAVEYYSTRVPRNSRGEPILNDRTRSDTCAWLHSQFPGWHNDSRGFRLDNVEREVYQQGKV